MRTNYNHSNKTTIKSLDDLAKYADYSLLNSLNADPKATKDGVDHHSREVLSGHFVPVKPTPIKNPRYIIHSKNFFRELGFSDTLATCEPFMRMFSGDTSMLPEPMKKLGWACGYALSIYGHEYYDQCPFGTGNGYGDGRAISILEAVIDGNRWEMQLKGGGKTPYCRGADGKAVLRSSVREFLAQEHMHALGIPTSRSLSLYVSTSETVSRPWFRQGSYSKDPEIMIEEAVAVNTRVASSFLRVGQLELFGRRARKSEHPHALNELKKIVLHAIEREYNKEIDQHLPFEEKVLLFAKEFQNRLTSLVANWIRVGYCQGNFNSDNCAIGGYTLDFGPFGFIDAFDPRYQPWTGGGVHFSFFNQPKAAEQNFAMVCLALKPLLDHDAQDKLEQIRNDFFKTMQESLRAMWTAKLGLQNFDATLFNELMELMIETEVDYTIFFRELSWVPEDITLLTKSFYHENMHDEALLKRWTQWLQKWRSALSINASVSREILAKKMQSINPKYTLREWFLVPAYLQAAKGDYGLIYELQEVMNNPYAELSSEIEEKYYKRKPHELFNIAGVSHVSCSS
ncbi:MAG: YdiU family protein [Sulfurospirillum sp.]|nr:YdiU family protein [Sulfurospirillum sp.]